MHDILQFLVSVLEDGGEAPNLNPIADTIKAWASTFITFLGYVGGIVAAVFFVLQTFKLMKAEDPSERHSIKIHMFWIAVGCVICAGGGVVANVFAASFFNKT